MGTVTIQVTEEMEDAYVAAAYASHEQVTASVAAGLEAVLAIVERDHHCINREDYDGERIVTHCAEHCPRVLAGDWTECRGC